MAVPSNYITKPVDIGANTYSKPVQTGIADVISGTLEMFGKQEQKSQLDKTAKQIEAEKDTLFSTFTPAQQELIAINEKRMKGEELTAGQQEAYKALAQDTGLLRAAVEQGTMKVYEFRRRQEKLLRDFKQQRPDLAQEADRLWADTLGFDVRGAAMDYYNYNLKLTENIANNIDAQKAAKAKADSDLLDDMFRNEGVWTKDLSPEDQESFRDEIQLQRLNQANGIPIDLTRLNKVVGQGQMNSAVLVEEFKLGLVDATTGKRGQSGKAAIEANIASYRDTALAISQDVMNGNWPTDKAQADKRIFGIESAINSLDTEIAKYRGVSVLREDMEAYDKQITGLREVITKLREDSTPANVATQMDNARRILINSASVEHIRLADETIKTLKSYNIPFDEVKIREGILEAGGYFADQQKNNLPINKMYLPPSVANKIPTALFPTIASTILVGKIGSQQLEQIAPALVEAATAQGVPIKDNLNGKERPRDATQLMGRNGVIGYVLVNEQALAPVLAQMDRGTRHILAMSLLMNLDRYNVTRIQDAVANNQELPRNMAAGSYSQTFINFRTDPSKMSKFVGQYKPYATGFDKYDSQIKPTGLYTTYDANAQKFLDFVINNLIIPE
jgi:hypothetical protein